MTRLFLLTGDPVANFFLGSVVLAMGCVVVGEMTLALAVRWNRTYIENLTTEIRLRESQSVQAHEMGDRSSHKVLNNAANDAWGKHFFMMAACSAGALWPVRFALAWMQAHFGQVRFLLACPLLLVFGGTVGFAFSFIPLYILCRIFLRQRVRWLSCSAAASPPAAD